MWTVLNKFVISDAVLKTAITATFRRRGTQIGSGVYLCFTDEFSGDKRKSVQWKAYLKKNGIEADCPNEFKVIVDYIASKVCPLLSED